MRTEEQTECSQRNPLGVNDPTCQDLKISVVYPSTLLLVCQVATGSHLESLGVRHRPQGPVGTSQGPQPQAPSPRPLEVGATTVCLIRLSHHIFRDPAPGLAVCCPGQVSGVRGSSSPHDVREGAVPLPSGPSGGPLPAAKASEEAPALWAGGAGAAPFESQLGARAAVSAHLAWGGGARGSEGS